MTSIRRFLSTKVSLAAGASGLKQAQLANYQEVRTILFVDGRKTLQQADGFGIGSEVGPAEIRN